MDVRYLYQAARPSPLRPLLTSARKPTSAEFWPKHGNDCFPHVVEVTNSTVSLEYL
jgi:hypothetical protein